MRCVLLWNSDPAFVDVDMNLFILVELRDILADLVYLVSGCLLVLCFDLPRQFLLGQHHGLKVVSSGKTLLELPVSI